MLSLTARRILIVLAGLVLAIYLTLQTTKGYYFFPALLCFAFGTFAVVRGLGVKMESLALSFLVTGYIVGNRGFAQITPIGNLPVFLGELGLFLCLIPMVIEIAVRKELRFKLDYLSTAIIVWMIFCFIRVRFDVGRYGIVALRDFATVYYALFFFIAHQIVSDKRATQFFEYCLITSLLLLLLIYPIFRNYKEFFLYRLTFDNAPLIFYKGDLAGTFLGVGFFCFYNRYLRSNSAWNFTLAWACFFSAFATTSRAVMVGIALSFGLMMFARFFKLLVNLYGLLFLLILPATIYYGHIVNDVTQTRFYAVYEHMLSITDFSGTRTYKNRESMSTGANNRFRLEWWRTVIQDTLTTSPLTGLGFGYDLSDRFVLDYYQNFGEGFRTRSPHSIFLTIFG